MPATANLPLLGVATVATLYIIYRRLLPKPIPGIPYNEGSESRILGDIPNFLHELSNTGDFAQWFVKQAKCSNSPLKQVFLNPFTKPMVILSDPREAMDIMTKRVKDFDRPSSLADILDPVVGPSQLHLQSGPKHKMHRRLVKDTMTPHFLQTVVMPNIEIASENFIELWKVKINLAQGRPFAAEDDMSRVTLDGVLAFAFGPEYPYTALKPQLELVNGMSITDGDIDLDVPLEFGKAKYHPSLGAALDLVWYSEKIMNSVVYSLSWQKYKYTARFKELMRRKADMIKTEITKAIQKRAESTEEPRILHAIDIMVDREARQAERQGREPDFFSASMIGEAYLFIVAGHDTTSAVMSWMLKLLSDKPECQSKLRRILFDAYPTAFSENRMPSAAEMGSTSVPFLNAFMEESFRYIPTSAGSIREAMHDTVLLGKYIPKGTNIFLMNKGPGYHEPSLQIDEGLRSTTSQETKKSQMARIWENEDDLHEFKPERWLKEVDGKTIFDASAGAVDNFGAGPRGCFGRRLAYLEVRMLLTRMLWTFELDKCPEELSGYEGYLNVHNKPQKCFVRPKLVDHSKY